MKLRILVQSVTVASLFLLMGCATLLDGKQGLVLQVSDDDPKVWNQTLNNAMNVASELGDKAQIEIVAYGPGLKMLMFDSVVNNRLNDASKKGIDLVACGNTMKKSNVSAKDLHPNAKVVKAGVVQIMKRQEEGWSYVKP